MTTSSRSVPTTIFLLISAACSTIPSVPQPHAKLNKESVPQGIEQSQPVADGRHGYVTGQNEKVDCPGKKRALVLSGGGVRGAYQVGALWYLVNVLNCEFEHFIGTSTGAVTATVLAQATGLEELRSRVKSLVAEYKGVSKESDLVERRFLGELRIFLPYWLGGVDGMLSLKPVAERLANHLGGRPVRTDNLTVGVVSLQSRKIFPGNYRPDSVVDMAIGSASIPLVIEPSRARLWGRAEPRHLEGNILTLSPVDFPGIPDPACQIRLGGAWVVACENIIADGAAKGAERAVLLRLPTLSADELRKLSELIDRSRKPPEEKNARSESDEPTALEFEFTTYHQLVDGGVTDYSPFQDALDVPRYLYKELDTFIVLFSGAPVSRAFPKEEVRGGLSILKLAFEYGWDAYQDKAFWFDITSTDLRDLACDVYEWGREVERDVGPSKMEEVKRFASRSLRSLMTPEHGERECKWRPLIITIEPELQLFEDTLQVDPLRIRTALYHGCEIAAQRFAGPIEAKRGIIRSTGVGQGFYEPQCDHLLE